LTVDSYIVIGKGGKIVLKAALYNIDGNQVGEIDLKNEVFGVPVHEAVIHQAVVKQLAGRRLGTHDTKTRAEVRGGGRKPWRQKGTGRARHGSIRSPIWRKGGIIFGPHPRDYSYNMPKKMRRLALKSALSAKVKVGNLFILEDLKLSRPKTKDILMLLDKMKIKERTLLVTAGPDENVLKSTRNISGVKFLPLTGMNVYDILAYQKLIMTREALDKCEEALAK
jgi:large subunit ribosomal protein L4